MSSRLRTGLQAYSATDPTDRRGLCMEQSLREELQFTLKYVGAAAAMSYPIVIPDVIRILVPLFEEFIGDIIVITPSLKRYLDIGLPSDDPAAPVAEYKNDWWELYSENPVAVDSDHLVPCLIFHRAIRNAATTDTTIPPNVQLNEGSGSHNSAQSRRTAMPEGPSVAGTACTRADHVTHDEEVIVEQALPEVVEQALPEGVPLSIPMTLEQRRSTTELIRREALQALGVPEHEESNGCLMPGIGGVDIFPHLLADAAAQQISWPWGNANNHVRAAGTDEWNTAKSSSRSSYSADEEDQYSELSNYARMPHLEREKYPHHFTRSPLRRVLSHCPAPLSELGDPNSESSLRQNSSTITASDSERSPRSPVTEVNDVNAAPARQPSESLLPQRHFIDPADEEGVTNATQPLRSAGLDNSPRSSVADADEAEGATDMFPSESQAHIDPPVTVMDAQTLDRSADLNNSPRSSVADTDEAEVTEMFSGKSEVYEDPPAIGLKDVESERLAAGQEGSPLASLVEVAETTTGILFVHMGNSPRSSVEEFDEMGSKPDGPLGDSTEGYPPRLVANADEVAVTLSADLGSSPRSSVADVDDVVIMTEPMATERAPRSAEAPQRYSLRLPQIATTPRRTPNSPPQTERQYAEEVEAGRLSPVSIGSNGGQSPRSFVEGDVGERSPSRLSTSRSLWQLDLSTVGEYVGFSLFIVSQPPRAVIEESSGRTNGTSAGAQSPRSHISVSDSADVESPRSHVSTTESSPSHHTMHIETGSVALRNRFSSGTRPLVPVGTQIDRTNPVLHGSHAATASNDNDPQMEPSSSPLRLPPPRRFFTRYSFDDISSGSPFEQGSANEDHADSSHESSEAESDDNQSSDGSEYVEGST
ncbi:hypothetical protein H0H81_011006 [Sphagnurus paluster]|uniref:Uncharacterized protein n=1 Tax=Sphagnurus paluster TaxID=117069 RepID=A0A9P7FQN5_9AGAR|nr:hypothetical protein H0H81_011006 [Sphagnurus paluster]